MRYHWHDSSLHQNCTPRVLHLARSKGLEWLVRGDQKRVDDGHRRKPALSVPINGVHPIPSSFFLVVMASN